MNNGVLTKEQFWFLHEAVMRQYESDLAERGMSKPSTITDLYGIHNEYPENSLRAMMEQNERVVALLNLWNKGLESHQTGYISVETRYCLYQNQLNIQRHGEKEVQVPLNRQLIMQAYIGVNNPDALDDFHLQGDSFTAYRVYFYSYHWHTVKEFKLKIDYSEYPYKVWMCGFNHNIDGAVYRGFGIRENRFLYVEAEIDGGENELFWDRINLILHLGNLSPNYQEIAVGTIMGISRYDYSIASEVVVLKERDGFLKEHCNVYRYLMLKQNSFRASPRVVSNPSKLRVNHCLLQELENMIGDFCTLNLDTEGNLVLSHLTIDPTYRGSFYTVASGGELEHQVCLVNMTRANGVTKMTLSTHPEEGIGLISTAFVDIPRRRTRLTTGVFSSIGNGRQSVSGSMVFHRMTNDYSLSPRRVPLGKHEAFLAEKPELRYPYEVLLKSNSENTFLNGWRGQLS